MIRTLVVANQTVESEPLHDRIVEKSREGNHLFTVIVPASGGARRPSRATRAPAEAAFGRGDPGGRPGRAPRPVHRDPERDAVLRRGRHPDLDIRGRALGLAAREPDRARSRPPPRGLSSTSSRAAKGRELMESASVAAEHAHGHDEHHGPPPCEPVVASRAAAARDAAFHHLRDHALRSVLHGLLLHPGRGEQRRGRPRATHLPVAIAGVNTAILLSSSVTMHWALEGAKRENRAALRIGLLTTFLLGAHLPDGPDQRVLPRRVRRRRERPVVDLLRPHRAPRRARLRRAHPAPVREHPRLPRPLHRQGAPRRRGARDLLALRRRRCGSSCTRRSTYFDQSAQVRARGVPVPAVRRRRRRGDRRARPRAQGDLLSADLALAERVAREAGALLMNRFGGPAQRRRMRSRAPPTSSRTPTATPRR